MSPASTSSTHRCNGLKLIQRKPIGDHRGYLERMFCAEELQSLIPGKASCRSTTP